MKNFFTFAVLTLFVFAATAMSRADAEPSSRPDSKVFAVFDNMAYAEKPDLSRDGLIPSCVLYERHELKDTIAAGQFPDEAKFKELVRERSAGRPGPIVIDIEYSYLSKTHGTTDAQVKYHFNLFITLARWAHEAAPGHLVGYYGHGLFPEEPGKEYPAETKELLAAVDAFFPSMYVHGNQTAAQWKAKLESLMEQARAIAPGKPVYPYVWAQYHEGGPKALEFVDAEYMKFQLETARDCGANGVVFWSGRKPAWKDDAPWLQAVLKFVAEKPLSKHNVKFARPNTGTNGLPAFPTE